MGDLLEPILNSPQFQLASQLFLLFYVIFSAALVYWTWRDAARRDNMAWLWGLAVLLFSFMGAGVLAWFIYMIVRKPEYADDVHERELEIRSKELVLQRDMETCPACLKPVEKDFLICPYCMKKLRKECVNEECGRALKLNWGVCPYCKTKQA